ncbi:putative membrane protein [Escherichia coli 2-156-04_S3_C2]|nr:putative membrane protein [Escherichia coli 2-156-04_S3_C2]
MAQRKTIKVMRFFNLLLLIIAFFLIEFSAIGKEYTDEA